HEPRHDGVGEGERVAALQHRDVQRQAGVVEELVGDVPDVRVVVRRVRAEEERLREDERAEHGDARERAGSDGVLEAHVPAGNGGADARAGARGRQFAKHVALLAGSSWRARRPVSSGTVTISYPADRRPSMTRGRAARVVLRSGLPPPSPPSCIRMIAPGWAPARTLRTTSSAVASLQSRESTSQPTDV